MNRRSPARSRFVTLVAAGVTGLLAGVWLAQRDTLPVAGSWSPRPPDSESAEVSVRSNLLHRFRARASGTVRFADRLEQRLAQATGYQRRWVWLEAFDRARASDFPDLVRLARKDPAMLQALASRWIELDARHCFETLLAETRHPGGLPVDEISRVLFEEWPRRNAEEAIAALSENLDLGAPRAWQASVATTVIQHDIERGLRLFAEWKIENYLPFSDRRGPVPRWAAADPRHAAEVALQHPAGYLTRTVMEIIGQEWGKSDPLAALSFTANTGGPYVATVGREALKAWAERDRNAAAAWLSAADGPTRQRLSSGFAEAWARTDPAAALAWCQEHLTGSSLVRAAAAVVEGAGTARLAEAAALVSRMEPSSARSEAAASIARKWFPSLGGVEGPSGHRTVTPETLDWLRTLDAAAVRRVLEKEAWSWATSDPTTMAGFLLERTDQALGDWPEACLARQWARQSPAEALEWTRKLPKDRALTTGGEAYAEWRSSQPDAAAEWLDRLAPDDPRRTAFFRSHIRSLAYNPQGPEQLAAMAPADRARAESLLAEMKDLPPEIQTMLSDRSRTP